MAAVAAVGAASAQVTLYGKVDMGVIGVNNGGGVSSTSVNSGILNGSRFGLKGTDDLGNGMSMGFVLESGISADTGAAAQGGLAFGRQAFISLNTAGGSLTAGRQYTPGNNAMCSVDLSGCAGPGAGTSAGGALYSTYALMNVAGADNFGAGRQNNAVAYTLPGNLGGLMGQVMLAPSEDGTTAVSNDFKGIWLGYATGPFQIQSSHEQSTAIGAMTQYATFLGATYDAGVAKIGLSTNIASNAAQTDDVGYAIQLAMPVGPIQAVAAFATEKSTIKGAASSASTNAWSIQGIYALSKKSRAYGGYISQANQAAAAGSQTITATAYNVGIQTDF